MIPSWFALGIELIVAGLLATTIGYCVLLNRRLAGLRANERVLRETIVELVGATENAERAIAGLRTTVKDCEANLGDRIRTAERFTAEMDKQLRTGRDVIDRIAQIAELARSSAVPRAARPEGALAVVARADAPASAITEAGVNAFRAAAATAPQGPRAGSTLEAAKALAERTRLRAAG